MSATVMIDQDNRVIGENSISKKKLGKLMGRKNDDKLLDLFWNRADLKKQFSGAKDEVYELQNQLKEAHKNNQRVKDDMTALENRLADPVDAYNAMVFFQLRDLWDQALAKLEGFCEELTTQQKDRERKKQIMEFNQERQKRLVKLNDKIVGMKKQSDQAKKTFKSIEVKYNELTGILSFFKRKQLKPTLEQNRESYEAARGRIESLFDERIKIESEPWPDFPGLSIEGKRVMNTAIIALAQHLCVHFSEHSLSSLARTAVTQKLQKVDYGSKSDCEYLMNRIQESLISMREDRNFGRELKARSKWLRSKAKFRSEKDTRPLAGSIGGIPVALPGAEFGNTVAGMPLEINVLAEDYWNLSTVLIT